MEIVTQHIHTHKRKTPHKYHLCHLRGSWGVRILEGSRDDTLKYCHSVTQQLNKDYAWTYCSDHHKRDVFAQKRCFWRNYCPSTKVNAGERYKRQRVVWGVAGVSLRRGRVGSAPELERSVVVKWWEDVKGLVRESRHWAQVVFSVFSDQRKRLAKCRVTCDLWAGNGSRSRDTEINKQ